MRLAQLAAARQLPLHCHASAEDQALGLAQRVAGLLGQALAQRGVASLALSGGRSPRAFLQALDQQELDWRAVRVTLVDERWVPDSDQQSNARLLHECMPNALAAANWLPFYRGVNPSADAAAASSHLQDWLPLDIVVLGMGADGHCASLFPGQSGLQSRLAEDSQPLCEAVAGPQGGTRLTLTGSVLHAARHSLLAIAGEEKYTRLCEAFDGQSTQWPVAAFLAPPLEIFYSPEG